VTAARLSAAEYRRLRGAASPAGQPPAFKYRNRPTVVDGVRFDSKAEAARYHELLRQQAAGLIRDLARQVRFALPIDGRPLKIVSDHYPNGRAVVVVMDFTYRRVADDRPVAEDLKGLDNPLSRLKRALFEHIHGIPVTITRAARRRPNNPKNPRHLPKKTVK
jgi:hypothetical protein